MLLFSSDLVASRITPDNRRLRAFDKIDLAPGQTRRVSFTIPASDLAYVDGQGRWILERGDFRLQAGSEVTTVTCAETREYTQPNRPEQK